MGVSLAQQFAALPQACQDAYLAELTDLAVEKLLTDWEFWARPEQLTPDGDWFIWLLLCGRGFGKSRTTAETLLTWVVDNPVDVAGNPTEWMVAGKTHTATVNAMLRGPSGLFQALRARGITYVWNKNEHQVTLSTGQIIHHTHGDDEDLGRGLNLAGAALDEFGTWKRAAIAFKEALVPAVRAMVPNWRPRILIATTPKVARKDALNILKDLVRRHKEGDPAVVVTRGKTFDNAANLAPQLLEELLASYPKGSRAYKQELEAEILDEIDGAVWEDFKWIDDHRRRPAEVPDLFRKLIVVDPAIKTGPNSDETGIIFGGAGRPPGATEDHVYVLQDLSGKHKSNRWVSMVVDLAVKEDADVLVEVDQGGDVWKDLIEAEARRRGKFVRVRNINASSIGGKAVRASAVVGFYQNGRVHHVGDFEHLEVQQTTWVPGDGESPDRLDAAVYLVRDLFGLDKKRVPLAAGPAY